MATKQKDILDKFYSSQKAVQQLLKHININDYDTIIEPSAGSGSFLKQLPSRTIAYDLSPDNDQIHKMNWINNQDIDGTINDELFIKDKSSFFNANKNKILVIGNPPFGKNNKIAKAFINEAGKFADTIAFILPRSFMKDSVINSLPINYEVVVNEIVQDDLFDFYGDLLSIPTTILIIKKLPNGQTRKKIVSEKPKYFDFTHIEKADAMIVRVGGSSGTLKPLSMATEKNKKYNYFIKLNHITYKELENKFKQSHLELLEIAKNTTGPRSLSQGEIAKIINKY